MVECMRHEAFYESGFFESADCRVAIGWTSHPGMYRMPVWNQARDVCLILTGEEFSGPVSDWCNGAPPSGHYLIDLYEQYGDAFFERLNGWFSGLLVDTRNKSVFLFNDRYGLSRIYYRARPEGFYFSSEAKSLLKILPDSRAIDPAALGELMSVGCVMGSHTLFKGVDVLPPASAWRFSIGTSPHKRTYFNPDTWEAQDRLESADFYREFRDAFNRVLPKYLRKRHALGISLTGGLDSRMIIAGANLPPNSVPCYTFGGPYRDCADVRLARKLATTVAQSHRTISVGADFLEKFLGCAERTVYISDGTMDVSGSVELYVNRAARSIAPIRVTGNYGSEIMRGYVAIRPGSVNGELFAPEVLRAAGAAADTYASEIRCHPLSFIAFKQVPWHHYSRLAVEQSQLTMRSPFLDNDLVALMYRAPPALSSSKELAFRLIGDGNASLNKIPTDRGLIYQGARLSNRVRNCYHEFTSRAEYAYDYGMPQWLTRLDRAFSALRPETLFLGRHKFYHFRIWYRRELARSIQEVLLDPRSQARSHVERKGLVEMVERHVSGRGNYTTEIHQALTLELLHRTLLDS